MLIVIDDRGFKTALMVLLLDCIHRDVSLMRAFSITTLYWAQSYSLGSIPMAYSIQGHLIAFSPSSSKSSIGHGRVFIFGQECSPIVLDNERGVISFHFNGNDEEIWFITKVSSIRISPLRKSTRRLQYP